jgi:serine/threonine protein kinase
MNKQTKQTKQTKKSKGGKSIASGGFGCVFLPALKCKNKTRTKGISKLSFLKQSEKEFDILEAIKYELSRIPNYKKYFLIDNISICTPDKLEITDKINLDRCTFLGENGIYAENINKNLSKFKIINMPYGGKDLDNIISNKGISFEKAKLLLINLLLKAIIPMNKLNMFHLDIKSNNILFNKDGIKIIDYGEMALSNRIHFLPNILLNKSIQFNSPFSVILFNQFIINNINKLFAKSKIKKSSKYQTKFNIVQKSYLEFKNRFLFGRDHTYLLEHFLLPAISKLLPDSLVKQVFNVRKEDLNANQIVMNMIIKYCLTVIDKYYDFLNYQFKYNEYFSEIYSKNVDVYGFIMCFMPYILTTDLYSTNLRIRISQFIIKYCFSPQYAIEVIPINRLLRDLKKINL